MKDIVNFLSTYVLAILFVCFSEFFRNDVILKEDFILLHNKNIIDHFTMDFSLLIYIVWSLFFVFILAVISERFNFYESLILSWLMIFVMMCFYFISLNLLSFNILFYTIFLGFFETLVVLLILKK